MSDFSAILVPLSVALGLSLMVERTLELGQNLLERFLGKPEGRQVPKEQAERVLREVEKARESRRRADQLENTSGPVVKQLLEARRALASTQDAQEQIELKKRIGELQDELIEKDGDAAWEESVPASVILIEPANDPDDARTLKPFILQILGLATGIILAAFNDLRLFGSLVSSADVPATADHLLTGLLIGGGSAPIHVLIRFVSERKVPKVRSSGEEHKEATAQSTAGSTEKPGKVALPGSNGGGAPSIATAPPVLADGWLDVAYKGGVDPDALESIHLRGSNPDLIVYHHTAMNSSSSFDDVVRVIKSRKDSSGNGWVTGYNCVVTYDGAIRPFCRWDRYGNHAAGFNRRSLGIAFNGNFENNPNTPYSNANGRYGARQPSEAQLKSGARMIALWTYLYDIDVDFDHSIIPHQAIAKRACPGSMFPDDELKKWVDLYRTRWQSATVQDQIAAFKLKPFLYN